MCKTAESFVSAIEAAPDDDSPKLVYADWLDENDRPEEAATICSEVSARVRAGRMVKRKRDTAIRVWEWAVKRAERLKLPCRSALECIEFSHAYAEPGYTEPECGLIAFGNWNGVDYPVDGPPQQYHWRTTAEDNGVKRLGDLFERLGVSIEWSDEWSTCGDCGKAVRTSPDSYGWTPAYNEKLLNSGGFYCLECEPDKNECGECGEELDKDCNGNDRCPDCDGPCSCCSDQSAESEDDDTDE